MSAPGYQAINRDSYWSMIGYAFYMFEGIGCCLPVMRETEKPQNFAIITLSVQFMLLTLQTLFSSLCYYAWGNEIVEPIITEILPSGNTFVQVMKFLYCINLIYSYRISIVPTFTCLETYILKIKETNKDEDDEDELGLAGQASSDL